MGNILAIAAALLIGICGASAAFLVVFALRAQSLPGYLLLATSVATLLAATGMALALFSPVVAVLVKLRRRTFRATLAAGAMSSGLPAFVILWPLSGASGWLAFLGHVAYWASLGAFGAWLFHLALRGFSPNNSSKPTPLRGAA